MQETAHLPSTHCNGWCAALAAAVVSHTALPEAAVAGLRAAFINAGVRELRIVLANGSIVGKNAGIIHKDTGIILDVYTLIANGIVNAEPLVSDGTLPGGVTLAEKSMTRTCVLLAGVPMVHAPKAASWNQPNLSGCTEAELVADAESYSDWQDMLVKGAEWLLACPLACEHRDPRCHSLLGALLVAGSGPCPTIDAGWLHEWSCELAGSIAHASVSVMEGSLDMLRMLFPPRVVGPLVANAVPAQGSKSQLLAAAPQAHAASQPDSSLATSLRPSEESGGSGALQAGAVPLSIAAVLQEATQAPCSSTDSQPAAAGLDPDRGIAAPPISAFAAATPDASRGSGAAGRQAQSLPSSPSASIARRTQSSPTSSQRGSLLGRSISLPRFAVSAGDTFAATPVDFLFRQASQHSNPSLLLAEEAPAWSPADVGEVSGYEDLLLDDALQHAARMPSCSLERAHSKASQASRRSSGSDYLAETAAGATPGAALPAAISPSGGKDAASVASTLAAWSQAGPSSEMHRSREPLPVERSAPKGGIGAEDAAALLAAAAALHHASHHAMHGSSLDRISEGSPRQPSNASTAVHTSGSLGSLHARAPAQRTPLASMEEQDGTEASADETGGE